MTWLPLALLCAFALASADAATKAWLGDYSARELALIRFSLSAVLLLPLLGGLPSPMTLPAQFWGWMLLMWPLEIAAMLLYMAAIRDHPLSLTVPFLAFTPVFVVGIAYLLLGEQVSAQGLVGIVLVVVGAWLLNVGRARLRDWRSWARPLAAILWEPGSRMMLAVAVIFAFTSTMGKIALEYIPAQQFGAFYFMTLGLLVPLLFATPGLRRMVPGEPRSLRRMVERLLRRPAAVLTVAALNALMIVTHFMALALVEVAYMIAVKRTSLLFGILYGALLFREPDMRTRMPAGAVMLAGVAIILTG
ncbi:MAG: EamA family transporter [Thiohalocapsa sp.]|nr:EamA family transporter [Thiohalocapsa sp.]MCF7991278.1 EamA family transporter [Thiohalocapsa sp.]